MLHSKRAAWLALGAIALWATLAPVGVRLSHLPPFLTAGCALLIGSVVALPWSGFKWRLAIVPGKTLALGIYGLFGYHFFLFLAFRTAPAVQANLVNYLWPLLIVVLAPLFNKHIHLKPRQVIAALAGFSGAVLVMTNGQSIATDFNFGYLAALACAFIWASYSLMTQRVAAFHTAAIGGFGFASGLLALACHFAIEAPVALSLKDAGLLLWMGLGPLGLAFYLWDAALKNGNAQHIGLLSFLTPLGSTLLLLMDRQEALTPMVACAGILIVGGAWLGRGQTAQDAANDPQFDKKSQDT
ncbi:MAG: DMT family transporter [Betaproteobacteria bacterium]|nr:DMT family transporter [Betaproteobacteria bacterium]